MSRIYDLIEEHGSKDNLIEFLTKPSKVMDISRTIGAITGDKVGHLSHIYESIRSKGYSTPADIREFAANGIPIIQTLSKVLKVPVPEVMFISQDRPISFDNIELAFSMMAQENQQQEMEPDRTFTASLMWERIKNERRSQIDKHNYSVEWDKENNTNGQLLAAAKGCITGDFKLFPAFWHPKYLDRIMNKSWEERMVYAGAFLLAERDRTQKVEYFEAAKACALLAEL